MNNDYRPPACLVSFYVTRNTFTINIGLTFKDCPSSFSARPTDDLLSSIFVVN